MANQAPGGIVYDGDHQRIGLSDEAVKEVGTVVEHVSDRFFDTWDRHPDSVVLVVALIVIGIVFQGKRIRDNITLNRELRTPHDSVRPRAEHQPQSRLTTHPEPRHLPRGKTDGS